MRHLTALALATLVLAAAPAQARSLYVEAGRLLDVETGQVSTGQCLLTQDERIARIEPCGATPAGAERVDWSAYTVLPGLIDLHTHLADAGQDADLALPMKTSPQATALIGAQNARTTMLAGFTTVRDVGTYRGLTDVALRDAINLGRVPGPRMFVAGAYITTPGGGGELNGVVPNDQLPPDMRLGVSSTPEETRQKAEFLFANGVDFLKLIATGAVLAVGTDVNKPELSEDQMRAAVEVARAHGSYATAHAHGAEGLKAAIRAGVHSIEHASLIDDEGLRMAKDRGVWLVMDIFNGDYIEDIGTKEGWPAEYLEKNRATTDLQRENFAKAVRMGVRIGFGTDSGVYPHGMNARQFAYMVRYGMTPLQAIRAATIDAATLIGHEKEIGSLKAGKFADMIAVSGDPLADVRTLENVAGVVKGGERYR
ncbi:amidohydrolase family protein [Croceibacterium sp. LX-88]|uniref:Amidohydrolase family protein n=1 Tax=Croceibacterium selenioxidans TaxID=2838833 RepID=A0ABS5W5L4_9SPHN|nr:amidohydrolase family protein [Croceibacterium selenioxidans]MBT2135026.1 amidohydrolase family protein [Croceibacterium selenioxidans]